MAASYSSFLSTRFYSSAFNTALFDGPFRIYFSQSYESAALKIYHLLQSDHNQLWTEYKRWADQTKRHAFILVYPTAKDVKLAFASSDLKNHPVCQTWDDGFIIGFENPETDADFQKYFEKLILELKKFSETFPENVIRQAHEAQT
jgi:hypothetical protein